MQSPNNNWYAIQILLLGAVLGAGLVLALLKYGMI